MRRAGALYHWPDEDDQFWQELKDIICDMPHPHLNNCRGQLVFPEESLENAKKIVLEWEFVRCVHFK